jgi:hypothetical protein
MAISPRKKITVKEFGNLTTTSMLAKVTESEGGKFFVGRIYGAARAQSVVETAYGGSIKFVGEFRGMGWDGQEIFSAVCYLASPADELLSAALNEATGDGKQGKVSVEFAFDYYAVPDKGILGYKYVVESLLDVQASDPIASLGASLPPLVLIAAPQTVLQLEDKSEETVVKETAPAAEVKPKADKKAK